MHDVLEHVTTLAIAARYPGLGCKMGKEERYVKPVVVIRPPESYHQGTFDSLDCISVERKVGDGEEDVFDIRVQASGKQQKERQYSFANAVYGFGGKPIDDLCVEQIEPLLRGCLVKGESAAVIAFGETGAGKSFVCGTQNIATERAWEGSIGSFTSKRIFELEKELNLVDLVVECSMIEIYKESLGKEQVFDLLDGFLRKKLSFACGSKQQHAVESSDALYDHLRHGSMLRNTDRTDGNLRSSRSHAIFTIDLSHRTRDGKKVFGKFMLVDLAGSESASSAVTGSQQQKQGSGINVGLSALQTVINDVSQTGKSVNYRLSRLTYDLRSVLGGGTDCDGWSAIFIGCISPFRSSERTANTLKYIYGASKIKNIVQQNVIDMGNRNPCKHCKVLEKRIDLLEKSLGKEGGQRGRVVVLERDEHKRLLKELEGAKARVFALEEVIRTADENYEDIYQENKKLIANIEELKKDRTHNDGVMPDSNLSDRMRKPGLSAMALSPLVSAAELKVEQQDEGKLSPEELCIVADESNLDEHQHKTLLKIVQEVTECVAENETVDTEESDDKSRVHRLLKERNCLLKSLHVYNEYLGSAKEERDIAQVSYQSCLDLLSQAVHEKVQYVELSAKLSHALDMSQNDVFELQNEIVGMKTPAADSDPHVTANIFSRLLRRTQPSERDGEKSPVTSVVSAPQTPEEDTFSSSETQNRVATHPLEEVGDDEGAGEEEPNHFGNRLKSFVDSWKKPGILQ